MSDGIDIPITVPGADLAKIALDQIVRSFTDLEREVIRAAEKSDATKDSFAKLKDQFHTGAITAVQLRESLSGIAAQSSQVSAAMSAAGGPVADLKTKSKSAADALVDVKDRGLDALAEKAAELGQRIGGVGGQIANVAIKSVAAFGGIGIAVTAVGAALAFGAQAYDEYAAKVALTEARTQELTSSVTTLGTTYPSMTAAVEGATTAVEAHTRAVAENQRILGQQLDLMNRGFSADTARAYTLQIQQTAGAVRELGTFLHGASEEQIRATLETGNATAQQELLGVSFAHSADAAEENRRRVEALAVVHQRAAVAIEASKREAVTAAEASLESARADLVAARGIEDSNARRSEMAAASRRVTEATNDLTEAQQRAAAAHREVAAGAADATRAEDDLASATAADAAAAEASALQRGYAAIARIVHEREQRQRSASHASGHHRDTLAELKQKHDAEDSLLRAQESALRERYRLEREEIDRTQRAALDAMIERARLDEEGKQHAIQAEVERAKAVSEAGRRATMTLQRQETRAGQSAELADLRDPAVQRERIDEMRRAHTLDRERSHLTQRYEMQRTFVDRMEELNDREVNGNEALATSITSAFRTTGDALSAHLQAFADGRETAAEAMQNMLADTLKNIGKESLAKAGFYFATGLGNLATLNFPGAATAFAASAAFAAVGGGLIAGGSALTDTNTLGARKDAAKSAESSSREPAASVSGSRGSGEGAGTVYNITFGGPMYGTGGVRQAARQMVGAINRGGIQGGVQLLPGVLQGAGAGT